MKMRVGYLEGSGFPFKTSHEVHNYSQQHSIYWCMALKKTVRVTQEKQKRDASNTELFKAGNSPYLSPFFFLLLH